MEKSQAQNLPTWVKYINSLRGLLESKKQNYIQKKEEKIISWIEESWKQRQRKISSNKIETNNFYKNYLKDITNQIPSSFQTIFNLYEKFIPEKIEQEYICLANLLSDYNQYVLYINAQNKQLERASDFLQKQPKTNKDNQAMDQFSFYSNEIEKRRAKLQKIMEAMQQQIQKLNFFTTFNQTEITEEQLKVLETFGLPDDLVNVMKQHLKYYIKMRINCFKEIKKEAEFAIRCFQHHNLVTDSVTSAETIREYQQMKYYGLPTKCDKKSIEAEENALTNDISRIGLKKMTQNFYVSLNLKPKCVTIDSATGTYDYYDYQSKEMQKRRKIDLTIMKIISSYLEKKNIQENDLRILNANRDWMRKNSYDNILEFIKKYEMVEEQKSDLFDTSRNLKKII